MRTPRASDAGGQFCRFVLIGGIGFVVDAGVLTLLIAYVTANLYVARLASFSSAVVVTWICNRAWTFPSHATMRAGAVHQLLRYVAIQSIGSLTNLAVFFAVIHARPALGQVPIIPLAFGAVCGLIVNFLGSRLWVFAAKGRHGAPEAHVLRRHVDSR